MKDPTEMDGEHVLKMCEEFSSRVMEHAESVRIFISGRTNSGTRTVTYGKGNWYAQRGQVSTWNKSEDERDCIEMRQSTRDDDDGSDCGKTT